MIKIGLIITAFSFFSTRFVNYWVTINFIKQNFTTVKEVYSFEIPSSTEWSYSLSFSPDIFFDISETINIKLKTLKKYQTELRESPHPRSWEGVKLIAKLWGMKVGLNYAEAFKVVRLVK